MKKGKKISKEKLELDRQKIVGLNADEQNAVIGGNVTVFPTALCLTTIVIGGGGGGGGGYV